MDDPYPRDLVGYGRSPPDPEWPGGAGLAVQFVVNYEEGGENTVLNGDAHSETFLSETPGGAPVMGARNINAETMYEYGSRAGFWRLMRLFEELHRTGTAVVVATHNHALIDRFRHPCLRLYEGRLTVGSDAIPQSDTF